jgi:hypothetical protein
LLFANCVITTYPTVPYGTPPLYERGIAAVHRLSLRGIVDAEAIYNDGINRLLRAKALAMTSGKKISVIKKICLICGSDTFF